MLTLLAFVKQYWCCPGGAGAWRQVSRLNMYIFGEFNRGVSSLKKIWVEF